MEPPQHRRIEASSSARDVYYRRWADEQRGRLQEALLQGEERLRALLEDSMVAIYLKDTRGRYIMANHWAEVMFRVTCEEAIGKTDHELFPKEVADALRANDSRALEAGAPLRFEQLFLHEDGEYTYEATKFSLHDASGDLFAVCGIATDVTELKRAEKTLKESEERFRVAFEDAPIGVSLVGLDSRYLWVNRALCEMLGYSEEELLAKTTSDLTYPDDLEVRAEYLSRALEGEIGSYALETRYLRSDGTVVWHLSSVSLIRDSEGEPGHFVCIHQDLTERKRAEARLRLLESVAVNANDAVLITEAWPVDDPGPEIVYANEAFTRMTGYETEEVLGKTPRILQGPDTDRSEMARVREALSRWEPVKAEMINYRKDGSRFWVEMDISPVADETGYFTHWISVQRETTERKQVEEALKESEDRYRTVIEQSAESIFLFDADTKRALESNTELQRLLGYAPEELLGMEIYEFIAHEKDEVDSSVRLDLQEERRFVGERKYRRKDGSLVDVECSMTVIPYRGRRAICAVARDITERKRAEEALRKSEASLAAAQQLASLGSWEWDAKTGEVWWSDETFRIYGYEPREFTPNLDRLMEIIHPDDRELLGEKIEGALHRGELYDFYHRILLPDGAERIIHRRAEVVLDEEGEPLRMIGAVQDVTERRRMEEALRESEERFRNLVQNASDIVKIVDPDGTLRYASPAFERVLGYDPEEAVGMNVLEYVHPEDIERVLAETEKAMSEPGTARSVAEYRFRHADGSWRRVESVGAYLLDEPGIEGVVMNVRDVTERRQAEEELERERNLLRTLIDNMPDLIFVKDAGGRFAVNNIAHALSLGAENPEDLIGQTEFDRFPPDRAERYRAEEQEILRSGRPLVDREESVADDGGEVRWFSTTKIPLRGADGEVAGLVGISRDITEGKDMEEQLRRQAFHDSLTGLPNRALFLDRLGHALARSERLREPVAVLFVDLDDFKVVNDSLGHDAGNVLLVSVAERIRACVRPGDTVARLFGDEFAVLLEAPTGVEEARRVTERITERLREHFDLDEQEVYASASVGIALSESAADDPNAVLRRADLAMYEAKRRGKTRYEIFRPSMNVRAEERLSQENELRGAIEREELEVHYQPMVDLKSGRVAGVEALARWRHPERGIVAPSEFIDLAEETGLIRPMGQWVLKEACRRAREWGERRPKAAPVVAVNLSTSQFSHQSDLIPEVLSETGLEPARLQLEITERAVMDDAEFSLGKLQRLKDLGVSFAIDDFGMGYSCLYYLKRMPLDSLKIDRAFIAGLGDDPGDEAIVAGAISLAHALGLKVVAEGVETAKQLARLEELGCDLAQGFYLARLLPAEAVAELLAGDGLP